MKKWLSKLNAQADQTQKFALDVALLEDQYRCEKESAESEDLLSIRKDVHDKMDTIKDLVNRVVLVQMAGHEEGEGWPVFPTEWTRAEKGNVCGRLCDMDTHTEDATILNVCAKPGGFIEEHRHQRVETIYVVEGSYVDPVSGELFSDGDVQRVEANQLHGLVSETGCLLVMKWRPAFPYHNVENLDLENINRCEGVC